ncbi:autotransporter domain-containing protein, partial [Escherichia coli]|nr:autotransporter domain-containing protein [Escherichia coli]MEC4236540.1 autotransporter domain-containing protein [Escherichia coli]
MQRKTLLSACIALALSGQGWAADITEVETTTGEKKNTNVTCPADPGKLSPEELKRLPSECSPLVEQNLMPWLSTGAAALITALAVVELNDDDDHHHRNNSPLPPTPPDDESDDTPVPPTPGGDEIIPDDPDDTPTPPKPVSFNNDVILDKTEKTLTIRDSVFTYTENADGTISLQDSNGRKATINLWQIDEANNTVALEGVSADGATKWQYNHNGELVITGDNATVNNNGKTTVDGKDSTGTEINGNNGKVIQDGDLDVSGGGHGIDITGDSATVDNKGTMTVTDPESIGIQIDGDQAIVNNEGESTITNGGTGTQINGNDATANNSGKTTVDGKDSTGTKIAGNIGIVNLDGSLTVTGGAHGVENIGDNGTVNNKGDIVVSDTGSIGVLINGEGATVSNTGDVNVSNEATGFSITTNSGKVSLAGSMQVGDFSTGVDLNGNNNSVTLAAKDLKVVGQKATGINVSGDANTVNITGNVLVDKDKTADNAAEYFFDPSVGINVYGSDNNVTLDGKLTVVSDSEVTSRQSNLFDGSAEKTSGLVVIGDGNTVNMNGGLELIGEKNALADGSQVASLRTGYSYTSVIVVSGESSVYLNGDTTISGEFPLGFAGVIRVQDKALLEIGSGATLTMQDIDSFEHHGTRTPELTYADSGAKIVNKGTVEIQNLGFAFVTGENTTGINSGTISLLQNGKDPAPSPIVLLATNGGSATNAGTITGKVTEQHSVFNKYSTGTSNSFIFNNDVSSITGLVAQSNSTIINTDSGIIDLYGRGSVGMLAIADSTAENQGKITLDSMWVHANDTTAMRDIASNSAIDFGTGVGVGTDSYSGAGKNATAINQLGGVITIYNAGAGMAAYGASNTVINQGTINLEKNGNYDDSLAANTLVGMAVYEHGTAINDQTGVININVGTGQAFYNDGTGTIVNYGTICTFGVCQSGNEYNNTDDFTSLIYTGGDTITRSGETVTLNKSAAVTDKLAGNVVNSGTLSGDQITVSSGLLENTSGGIINNLVKLDGNDSNLLIVFYVQIMPDDFVMQLHR